jgi:hypothetical protein
MTFVRCWLVLYRMVAMEVFGHMSFALTDRCPVSRSPSATWRPWSAWATRCPLNAAPRAFSR